MPLKLLYDVSHLDATRPLFTIDDIRAINPHRYEFEQLTSILFVSEDEKLVVGLRSVRTDEFWVRGHIPGRLPCGWGALDLG